MITAVKKQLCQEEKHVLGISHRDVLNNSYTGTHHVDAFSLLPKFYTQYKAISYKIYM